MPKQRKRVSPEEAQQHDDAVFKFIDAAADPVGRAEISQGAQIEDLGAAGRAIKRLAAAKKIHGVGRGPAVKWTTKPIAGKAAKATAKKKASRAEPPPQPHQRLSLRIFQRRLALDRLPGLQRNALPGSASCASRLHETI